MSATATRWWHVEDDVIVCDLCPRSCHLHDGQRAFCFVRQNVDGQMVLTTYGKSTGFCIDPIEKKPLNHFLPGTPVLSFGTAGCNLGCKFCQNWDISKSREIERLSESASPEAIASAAKATGCRSVAFTYNDPVIWAEYAIDAAIACHDQELKTVAVTAGYIQPEARRDFYAVMDAANVDLKAFTELFYKHLCLSKLQPVLDTLRWLKHESDVWFEITNLMIPDENDSPDEVARMCDWILENVGDDVPVHFTAFHPDFRMMDRPHTPHATLIRAHEQATHAGLQYVYVGNVHDLKRQSTYCPSCGALLIERDWYELGVYRMNGNRCGRCGIEIPGVFEARRGDWGRRRVPISIPEDLAPRPSESLCHAVGQPAPAARIPGSLISTITVGPSMATPAVAPSPPVRPATPAAVEPRSRQVPKVDYNDEQVGAILEYTRDVVESAVRRSQPVRSLPVPLADAATFGVFVTLDRLVLLRACRGRWGAESPLSEVLTAAARDAAVDDPRFPSIVPEELRFLNLDVSLMYDPQPIVARGADRVRAVEIGRHGLVISHPHGRGLLLPQVATEAGWDSATFLEHVCRKAGLPTTTWTDDAAELMTFQARVLQSPAPVGERDVRTLSRAELDLLIQIAECVLKDRPMDGLSPAAILKEPRPEELGICLHTESGRTAAAAGADRSMIDLVLHAARSLKTAFAEPAKDGQPVQPIAQLTMFWQGIPLAARDYPARHRSTARSAITVRSAGQLGFAIPPTKGTRDPIVDALNVLQLTPDDWIRSSAPPIAVIAFCQHAHRRVRSPAAAPSVRRPARAGQFYPDNPEEADREVDHALAAGASAVKRSYPAVMLPHAGWMYCGTVIGKTLARVEVPDAVVVLSPNHTGYGARWSVSPADRWDILGETIPIAVELRDRLVELVPQLECEPEAHRSEHGVEVLLPFLRRLNPRIQLVPMVIAAVDYEETAALADALAEILTQLERPPLLVISSDMNHFAPEPENRRLDLLALDAMRSGDPQKLFQTVRAHDITMCGVVPAVVVMRALGCAGRPLALELVDYTNSGQVTGDMSRVVGYAGMLLSHQS